ncbi:RasGEF domain-containing protein [Legionella brunensis]|uniref:RasGEF domain protein n=1 Tax=Legionella brunensis TaxID=29422 RepID=A0A0W0SUK5_9GAMM|nr:RasGEF domain-containing protein [Legionella brunensis]KTC87066.1 RasGEF domain protein [Legionella brunensis]
MSLEELEQLQKRATIAKKLALELNTWGKEVEANPLGVCEKLEKMLLNDKARAEIKNNEELSLRFKKLYGQAIHVAATSCMEKTRILFTAIPENELKTLYQFGKHQEQFPAYFAYNKYLNDSVPYIQASILNAGSIESCALAVERWIAIMNKCVEQNNYESARLIIDALQSPQVVRLNLASLLSEKADNSLAALNNLLGIDAEAKNFTAFRKKLNTSQGMGAIPLRGMLKKDLEFLASTRDITKGGIEVQNYNQHITKIIEKIKYAQAVQSKKPFPEINNFPWKEENLPSNDELYEFSYNIVPLGKKALISSAQIDIAHDIQGLTVDTLFRKKPTLNPTATYAKFQFSREGRLTEARAKLPIAPEVGQEDKRNSY